MRGGEAGGVFVRAAPAASLTLVPGTLLNVFVAGGKFVCARFVPEKFVCPIPAEFVLFVLMTETSLVMLFVNELVSPRTTGGLL